MRHVTLAAFVGVFLGFALAAAPAQARPPAEFPMLMRLNGEWVRPAQAPVNDGGGLNLWTMDAGIAVATVTGGQIYVLNCDVASHVCIYDGTTTMQAYDAGCNATRGDVNFGMPIAAATDRYVVLQNGTTKLFATPASSATMNCTIWNLQ